MDEKREKFQILQVFKTGIKNRVEGDRRLSEVVCRECLTSEVGIGGD